MSCLDQKLTECWFGTKQIEGCITNLTPGVSDLPRLAHVVQNNRVRLLCPLLFLLLEPSMARTASFKQLQMLSWSLPYRLPHLLPCLVRRLTRHSCSTARPKPSAALPLRPFAIDSIE